MSMQVVQTWEQNLSQKKLAIGLGNFDGLHIGHMSLLSQLLEESEQKNLTTMLYTFSEHTQTVLNRGQKPPQILTLEKKIQLLSRTKLDYLYLEDFTPEYATLTPEEFVKNILVDRFSVALVVIGFNYSFGHKGAGKAKDMQQFGEKYGFEVVVMPSIQLDEMAVSSTLIRQYIQAGDVERVRLCTGRYYSIYGTVEMGRQIGTTIGFPTANIIPEEYLALPRAGVYVTCTIFDGEVYNSITNVGHNPTFGALQQTSCETHIFGRDGNLYGKRIEVFFMTKLRDERKFENKEALCRQINQDIRTAREFFNAL